MQIVDHCLEDRWTFTSHADSDVALLAEQSANAFSATISTEGALSGAAGRAASVVVIHDESTFANDSWSVPWRDFTADLASAALFFDHSLKVSEPDSVVRPELAVEVAVGRFQTVCLAGLVRTHPTDPPRLLAAPDPLELLDTMLFTHPGFHASIIPDSEYGGS